MAEESASSCNSGLKAKLEDTDIKFLLPVLSSFSADCRGCLIPKRSANSLQKAGFGIYAIDHFRLGGSDPELYGVPAIETLTPLPWKPEVGWLAW